MKVSHVNGQVLEDRAALRATAPALELDFGHATETLRGVTWTIRRCS